MFAIIGAILVLLSAIGVHPDSVDLFQLGIAAAFLHFAWPLTLPVGPTRTRTVP